MGGALRVVVAGAGIGGLTAAIGLRRIGGDVRVLEQRAEPGAIGAGIALFPNALRCFDTLGVGEVVRSVTAEPLGGDAGGGLRLPSGRWLMHTHDTPDLQLLSCHRNDLHAALLRSLPPSVVEAATEVVAVRPSDAQGEGVEVTVRRTITGAMETRTADLLIGADGVGSLIRSQLWPGSTAPRYAGYTAWRAVTSRGEWRVAGGETWGRGTRFGIVPIADGRVYWFATDNRPPGSGEGLTAEQRHAEVTRLFGDWHDPIPRLLAATAPGDVLQHDIARLDPPLASFVHGRVVLLGDAAHAMTPDLGQGACQAVEDATVLAAELATKDVGAALAAYDAARRPRTQRVARSAYRIGQVAQLAHPIATAVRIALMGLVPVGALRSGNGWLLDWAPPPVPEVPQHRVAG